ncbi:capsid protein [Circoviridae sp.]|nr:capsid protein [Circoviridae sp.]
MPYGKRKRRTFKRKSRGKRRRFHRKNRTGTTGKAKIGRQLSVMSDKQLVRLRYCTQITLEGAVAGLPDAHVFRANSCYDPDQTGGGHQPYGYDQWSNFYSRYTVIGSKISAHVTSIGANNNCNGFIVCALQHDTTAETDAELIVERRNAKYAMLTMSTGYGKIRVTNTFSPKKFFNVKDLTDGSVYSAETTGNPNQEAYFVLYHLPLDAGIQTAATPVWVVIDYLVMFTKRKDMSQS